MDSTDDMRRESVFEIDMRAPVEKVFPLLCPVEEELWVFGWNYRMIYSATGRNERYCVFTETVTVPHFTGITGADPSVWMTTRHDPSMHGVAFAISSRYYVAALEADLARRGHEITRVQWRMVMTGLPGGVIKGMPEKMDLMLAFLGGSLKHYCEKGEMLRLQR